MENLYRGWGSRLVFICIIFMTVSQKCVGGENLTTVSCSEQERQALVKFKHSVRDENGMLSSWGVGKDCCEWERVGCDDATGRVISLHLRRNAPVDQNYYVSLENDVIFENNEDYLVGDEVNSCLKELVSLEHLDLSGNHFQQSRIPKFIGSLKQLSREKPSPK
ncbi:hypothetical protein SSX86_017779 [Deinandra increscens subsp. villosa]|uniref:Leucine-rich repeat-containing N-terminal plant-type domain-containing protein n=1 Tax=Deinandra increscens subsp. villosa TaxID=3103831 RepID=A0AAP0D0P4_9ASTR